MIKIENRYKNLIATPQANLMNELQGLLKGISGEYFLTDQGYLHKYRTNVPDMETNLYKGKTITNNNPKNNAEDLLEQIAGILADKLIEAEAAQHPMRRQLYTIELDSPKTHGEYNN